MKNNYLKRSLALLLTLVTPLAFSQKVIPKKQGEKPKAVEQNAVAAQVIATDLVVQGSACIGFDCVNGESFGFSTIRLKENNLRIDFNDTSNSSSFPSTDWELQANETSNGGANMFAILDKTSGRTPFRIEGGAKNNALYVDNAGRIGVGIAAPVVEMHIVDGDSPSVRIQQDGSSGFTPQTWDMAGNETNFFIRDATNGSSLPFRIRPGASSNALYIDSDNDIGLGTASPTQPLHIKRANPAILLEGDNNKWLVKMTDNLFEIQLDDVTKLSINEGGLDIDLSGVDLSSQIAPQIATALTTIGDLNISGDLTLGNTWNLDAGVNTFQIRKGTDAKISINGDNAYIKGAILPEASLPSDRRLKNQIAIFSNARSTIDLLFPKTFRYDLTTFPNYGFPKGTQYGLIAQEVEKVLPDYVNEVDFPDGKRYKTVNYIGLIPILLQSNKEQQAEIERLKKKISAYETLESRLTALEAKLEGKEVQVSVPLKTDEKR